MKRHCKHGVSRRTGRCLKHKRSRPLLGRGGRRHRRRR